MTLAAALLLIGLVPTLGWPLATRSSPTSRRGWRVVISSLIGLAAIHLTLLVSSLLGWPWTLGWLLPTLLFAVLASWLWARPRSPQRSAVQLSRPGWGEVIAALALVIYAVYAVRLLSLHPDFIFHWGIKGHKLYLARGIDFAYLTRPWNSHLHPDYPLLLPMLFALTALVGDGFDEAAMMLWSVFFFLLSLLALRELLLRLRPSPAGRETALATVAVVVAMFGIGYLQAGGADWLIVLAVLAALVPLLAGADERREAGDFQVALIAAFAAAAKIEGAPLAIFLLVLYLARRWRAARSAGERWRSLARTASLPLLTIGLWVGTAWAHELFLATNTGDLRWSRVAVLGPALFASLLTVNWHGFSFSLLALPFLALAREWRWGALLCLLQLLFYVYIYLSAPVDTRLYVETSAARLFFHLVPAVLTMAIVAADRLAGRLKPGR